MSSAVGSGSNPRTIADLRAAGGGDGGGEEDRPWKDGGRLRAALREVPLATLCIMLACAGVYVYQLTRDEASGENCVMYAAVVDGHEYARIIANSFFHLSFFHILMNMWAFYQIGSVVESELGTLSMLGLTTLFPVLIGSMYLLIEYIAAHMFQKERFLYQCAAGYSGVIFAYLIVEVGLAMQRGERDRRFFGYNVPIYFYPLILLLLISLFMPSVSFVGHLAGILVGFLYVRGLLLPLTLPRSWVRGVQECIPAWVRARPGWKDTSETDPFQSWLPPFCPAGSVCPSFRLPSFLSRRSAHEEEWGRGQRLGAAPPVAMPAVQQQQQMPARAPPSQFVGQGFRLGDGPAAPAAAAPSRPPLSAAQAARYNSRLLTPPPSGAPAPAPGASNLNPLLSASASGAPISPSSLGPRPGGNVVPSNSSPDDAQGVVMGDPGSGGGGNYMRLQEEDDDVEAQRAARAS